MPDGVSLTPSVAAVQSQAYILTLAKSLKVEQETAAQLLQLLPTPGGTGGASTGPQVSGLGKHLDVFA